MIENLRVIATAPSGVEDTFRLADAVRRGGGIFVARIRVSSDIDRAHAMACRLGESIGIYVEQGDALADVPAAAIDEFAILIAPLAIARTDHFPSHSNVVAEIRDLDEARAAINAPVAGVLARGMESEPTGASVSSFMLLQQVVDAGIEIPVWAAGGIGPHSAAGAVAGGAVGVLVDTQLTFFPETGISDAERSMLQALAVRGPSAGRQEATAGPRWSHDLLLASDLRDRFSSVTEFVRSVRDRLGDPHGLAATATEVLSPGAAGAHALGTELPLVQGPMTRVSDIPEFAVEVAREGALPAIAFAMMAPEEVRVLSSSVVEALGSRPWAAGLLGFLPDELYKAQVLALEGAKPRAAVLAGGRASQVRELEAMGIECYVHAPSNSLLHQLYEQGARRFVFEGSECGGHIGPLTSFVLWDIQVAALLNTEWSGEPPTVLFAGGISTSRSAAIAVAVASDLARRGAAVALLAGTAYVLTDEAVTAGAVTPEFQARLLGSSSTSLLESAPGHVVRCVDSPFTAEFEEVRARLAASGAPVREAAEQLEALNVGRLRIATKGVEHTDVGLVQVTKERQAEAGMFMAGDVVALHEHPISLRALHQALTSGAVAFANAAAADDATTPALLRPPPLNIAIVGMACVFAGAGNLDDYWGLILEGKNAIGEVPAHRWNRQHYVDNRGVGVPAVHSAVGGFIEPVRIDPARYGIPPASFQHIDPAQLLALEVSYRALQDAGLHEKNPHRERTAVIFGAESGSDLGSALSLRTHLPSLYGDLPEGVDAVLPSLTGDTFPGMLANVISGRIANRLDLGGANYVVDAACASSLAALKLACDNLKDSSADVAIAGGVDLHNAVGDYAMFSSVGALSREGVCKPFDRDARGIVLGEGVAAVVLKRLEDAKAAGDRIYGVIEGIGSSSDGRSRGLTAPRTSGQILAMQRAIEQAGIAPDDVDLIEAHGTGTPVGDKSELSATSEAYPAAPDHRRTLGSVKAQIGHTKCAAGMAGLIKATLALHTKVLPPTQNTVEPIDGDAAEGFVFRQQPAPWIRSGVRRAAVSAFGFGGTNFHALVREHPSGPPFRRPCADAGPALVVLSGRSLADAAHAALVRSAEHGHADPSLHDVAASLADDAQRLTIQATTVCSSLEELRSVLKIIVEQAAAEEADLPVGVFRAKNPDTPPEVAVLFPGQGSQRLAMFRELAAAFPVATAALTAESSLGALIYDSGNEQELMKTENAQPALAVTALIAHELLRHAGVRPAMYAGHSFGELAALAAAGAFATTELVQLSRERAAAMNAAFAGASDTGAMLAVSATEGVAIELISAVAPEDLVIANVNGPAQVVVSGPTSLIDCLRQLATERGVSSTRLSVSCSFHHPALESAAGSFADRLSRYRINDPPLPVWANSTALPYRRGEVVSTIASAIAKPVRFSDQVKAMWDDGARVFIEAGPGSVLTRLTSRILNDREHLAVGFETGAPGVSGYLNLLARLVAEGVPVSLQTIEVGSGRTPTAESSAVMLVDGSGSRAAASSPSGVWPAEALKPSVLRNCPAPTARSSGPSHREVERSSVITPAHIAFVEEELMPEQSSQYDFASEALQPRSEVIDRVPAARSESTDLVRDFIRATGAMHQSLERVVLSAMSSPRPDSVADHLRSPVLEIDSPQMRLDSAVHGDVTVALAPAAAKTTVAALSPVPPAAIDSFDQVISRRLVDGPPPVAASEPRALEAVDLGLVVREVVAERTGYPLEMIEPTLDLESDLSIDSIKRLEIAGELIARAGLSASALPDDAIEDLSKSRTVTTITSWLEAASAAPAPQKEVGASPKDESAEGGSTSPRRFALESVNAPLNPGEHPLTQALIVVGASSLANTIVGEAQSRGLQSSRISSHDEFLAGLAVDQRSSIILTTDAAEGMLLPDVYGPLRDLLLNEHVERLIVVALQAHQDATPPHDAGLAGLIKTAALEFPQKLVRILTITRAATASDVSARIIEELTTSPGESSVSLGENGRTVQVLARSERDTANQDRRTWNSDSTFVIYGGARGITSRVALELATITKARIEFVGSTSPAESSDTLFAHAKTERDVRAAVVGSSRLSVREAEIRVRQILAQREIRDTLTAARAHSVSKYTAVDVRNRDAVREHLERVTSESGHLAGVIFGSGVNLDQLITRTAPSDFRRVFDTKAHGALAVVSALDSIGDVPEVLAAFGSIAAVQGSKGQVGYTAGNDAMESIFRAWAAARNAREFTVNWGPWSPRGTRPGMVSVELEREFERRGRSLLDPDSSASDFIEELLFGPQGQYSIVLAPQDWVVPVAPALI